jgi:transcriptional regulator with XRE-family HTH domain
MSERRERAAEIGEIIRALRRDAGLTQEQLAMRAGVSKSVITLLESGKSSTRVPVLLKICEALDAEVVIRSTPSYRVLPPEEE